MDSLERRLLRIYASNRIGASVDRTVYAVIDEQNNTSCFGKDDRMARNYRYLSADSHFESPPEQWIHRVPKQYRERAPRRIKLANGRDGLQLEGQRMLYGGTSLYGGRPPETFDPTII